jgi:hypothetical protein
MRLLFSLFLIYILLLGDFSFAFAQAKNALTSSCENGECVPKLVEKLEDLTKAYRRQCLPPSIKESDITRYHEEHGLTEECWKFITEVNHLETDLQKHQARLEARIGCEGNDCKSPQSGDLTKQINELARVESSLSCTEQKKSEIKKNCAGDLACILAASALGIGGYLAEIIVPNKIKPKNCHLGDDSCLVNLATGFLKAALGFIDSAWSALKWVGKKSGEKMSEFWSWVKGEEGHTSTAQLAMAKASEDEGVFQMLLKDFPGTMKNIWTAFVASMKEWMKTDVLCQKWAGRPRFSQCLRPTESFDCISCKAAATGLCAIAGTIIAEVVPAFLTGGLVTAAKHGANAGVKIAKVFSNVSAKGVSAAKNSRLAKMATQTTNKLDEAIHMAKGLQAAKTAIQSAILAINKYLLSPTRKIVKTSFSALGTLSRKGSVYLAVSPAGRVIRFSGRALRTSAQVVLYPIDNPMTISAYNAGARSFDKVFKLGSPLLGHHNTIVKSLLHKDKSLETLLAQLEHARMSRNIKPDEILALEEALLKKALPVRREVLLNALNTADDTEVGEIIKTLYPELQYGNLARKLPAEEVANAEKEFFLQIQSMPEGARKTQMLAAFDNHVSHGYSRSKIFDRPFNKSEAMTDASPSQTRVTKLTSAQIQESKAAVTTYMDQEMSLLTKKADELEKNIKASKGPVVYDVVAIGGGPHNGIAINAMKEINPGLNVLVIESTENLGTFHKIKAFDINTPELPLNSGNTFPGSSVQLRDFNFTDKMYATAEDLGHLSQATYMQADSDLIFRNAVVKWSKEPTPGAWPAKYKVETSNGVVVYTNAGVAGTGFGTPITRLNDPASLKIVQKYEKELQLLDLEKSTKYAPKISSVDDFLTLAAKDTKNGLSGMERYRGKKVLVVGPGDGGNIAVEATAGIHRPLNPSKAATEVQTIWLGQEAKTGKEFLQSLNDRKTPRYSEIAGAMDDGRVKSVNGYLTRIEEVTDESGVVRFKAYYTTKEGVLIGAPLEVDHIVFATGYTNNQSTLVPLFKDMSRKLSPDGKGITFEPVKGHVSEYTRYRAFKDETIVTRQLNVNGSAEDVYVVGQAGHIQIPDEAWDVPTGGFIDILAPKSAATGRMVAQKLTPQSLSKTQMKKLLTPSQEEGVIHVYKLKQRPDSPQRPIISNPIVADIDTKVALGKNLRKFSGKPNTSFKIEIYDNPKGGYIYEVHGLDQQSAQSIVQKLGEDPALSHSLNGQFRMGKNKIQIDIKVRENGLIQAEDMTLVGSFVPLKIFEEHSLSIMYGIRKITAPSMQGEAESKDK